MKSVLFGVVALAICIVALPVNAALIITNGDFETGGGDNIDDVADWMDPTDGTFWHGTWQTNSEWITPNGTNVVLLGSHDVPTDANIGTMTGPVSAGTGINYLYQSIGTADSATSLPLSFDWGAPNDDPGDRGLGLRVAVYAYSGSGFSPDNNTDVEGDASMTLLDSADFEMTSTGVDGLIVGETVSLDLSGAGSQELFLRFNNYRSADTEAWPVLDNVSIVVPEPASLVLLGFGGLALMASGRRRG